MTTFSQIVDDIVAETLRLDLLGVIADYLRQTIRDMHIDSVTKMPAFYPDNRKEVQVILSGVGTENVYVWPIPKATLFQQMEAVYYRAYGVYSLEKKPSIAKVNRGVDPNSRYYWYRAGSNICMANPGKDGQLVDVSWFEYLGSLAYYAKALNPAIYDLASDSYVIANGYTNDQALALSTNWMIQRHADTLKEGVRAKIYKRLADMDRARLCYSQFETARSAIINTESMSFSISYGG
jgi:hypothetical protein